MLTNKLLKQLYNGHYFVLVALVIGGGVLVLLIYELSKQGVDLSKTKHLQTHIELLSSGDKATPPMQKVAVPLYDALLKTALNNLPRKVDRLRIVPDDFLLHLPFEALKAARCRKCNSKPLGCF